MLISWEISSHVPTHGRARFQHAEGFMMDFDINVPRGLSDEDREAAFNAEIAKRAAYVRDLDVAEYRERSAAIIYSIERDRRNGYSAD